MCPVLNSFLESNSWTSLKLLSSLIQSKVRSSQGPMLHSWQSKCIKAKFAAALASTNRLTSFTFHARLWQQWIKLSMTSCFRVPRSSKRTIIEICTLSWNKLMKVLRPFLLRELQRLASNFLRSRGSRYWQSAFMNRWTGTSTQKWERS